MNTENLAEIIEGTGTKSSSYRVINSSNPGGTKKFADLSCDSRGKACAPNSKIPRPPLMASNSFNENLKSNKGKTKRAPSMIPRSRSRKRNENDKFKVPSKAESLKNELNNTPVSSKKKSNVSLIDQKSRTVLEENKCSGQKLIELSSILKSCMNIVTNEGTIESSEKVQEELISDVSDYVNIGREEQEARVVQNADKNKNVKLDERETARQERTIRILYETVKGARGSPFDNSESNVFEKTSKRDFETERHYFDLDQTGEVLSIQGHYENTLNEISNIWKNTISLIYSVRDHAIQFMEENNKLIDKEQLALEADMLQLALDFAISYSKLKSDFLIKLARKRLNVKNLEKSELEKFLDSKAFAAFYNNDDLAAMARTVQDLNRSLLRGDDPELE